MKFYFAGKIGRDDWRHSIVLGLRDAVQPISIHGDEYNSIVVLPDEWPILRGAVLGQHDYVGPFFMPGTLRSGEMLYGVHGKGTHGNAIADDTSYISSGAVCQDVWNNISSSHGAISNDPTRDLIVRLCLHSIIKSDAVFVWMDSATAYGTLVEIGFALAHHKPIWWGEAIRPYDNLGEDFWFARTVAEMVEHAPDARTALERMLVRKFRPQINGYVYILRSGDFIKIGKSKNVDQRLTQISPKTPMPVTLLHTITCDDMSWAEAQLHRHYAHYRTNGEWFLLPKTDLDWLMTINHLSRTLAPERLR